jgi:hypothetical protein
VGGELELDALPTAHRPNSPPTESRTTPKITQAFGLRRLDAAFGCATDFIK